MAPHITAKMFKKVKLRTKMKELVVYKQLKLGAAVLFKKTSPTTDNA